MKVLLPLAVFFGLVTLYLLAGVFQAPGLVVVLFLVIAFIAAFQVVALFQLYERGEPFVPGGIVFLAVLVICVLMAGYGAVAGDELYEGYDLGGTEETHP